jgi:16S rRNA (adenine1518-N6/adenine1519-N6)-dimethyltransferase
MEHPSHQLRRTGGEARKRFGQHFLAAGAIVEKIVDAAGVVPGQRVLEIGPGLGALTTALLARGAEVVAVEIDRDLAAQLRTRFADEPRLRIVEGDAARIEDWSTLLEGGGWATVANLPYNVGTGIALSMLNSPATFDRVVVMVQREVADRFIAKAGGGDRGSVSVYVEARATAKIVVKVPPGAFHPPPKVDSAVVRFDLFPIPRTGAVSPRQLESVVRAAFVGPRKALRNTLSGLADKPVLDAALAAAGVEGLARPSELTLDQWVRLASALRGVDGPPPNGLPDAT